jgi:hypothetical protein
MNASNRLLLLVAFAFIALDGWWAFTHAADTPRFSGGFGSGFSPGTRRFWGGVGLVGALVGAVLTVVL